MRRPINKGGVRVQCPPKYYDFESDKKVDLLRDIRVSLGDP